MASEVLWHSYVLVIIRPCDDFFKGHETSGFILVYQPSTRPQDTYQRLDTKLQYLQCVTNIDTAVLCYAIENGVL